jgi:putative transposase
VQAVVATNPKASRWHIVCDQLNVHQSESLLRWVAELSGIQENLGVKGKSGILACRANRAAFLSEASHKVVFHYL